MSKPFICAIDPGESGGIAWYDYNGYTEAEKMPEDVDAFILKMKKIAASGFALRVYVEDVGTYMPGNSGPAAVTFARHCGILEGVLKAMELDVVYVRPQVWMKAMNLPRFDPISKLMDDKSKSAELARRKAIRKKAIKDFAVEKYPLLKVTLKTADALGILWWAHHYCDND